MNMPTISTVIQRISEQVRLCLKFEKCAFRLKTFRVCSLLQTANTAGIPTSIAPIVDARICKPFWPSYSTIYRLQNRTETATNVAYDHSSGYSDTGSNHGNRHGIPDRPTDMLRLANSTPDNIRVATQHGVTVRAAASTNFDQVDL